MLALVSHLFALAVLFLLLMAQFVAAAQIVVYAGAVMVLYVFVVAYIGGQDQPVGRQDGGGLTWLAIVAGGWPLRRAHPRDARLRASRRSTARAPSSSGDFGQPGQIGELLLTKFLLPFEVASFLLLVAAVGAVVLAPPARRDRRPDEAAHRRRAVPRARRAPARCARRSAGRPARTPGPTPSAPSDGRAANAEDFVFGRDRVAGRRARSARTAA